MSCLANCGSPIIQIIASGTMEFGTEKCVRSCRRLSHQVSKFDGIATFFFHLDRVISPGGTVSTVAGTGVSGSANGVGTFAQFWSPSSVVLDATGSVAYINNVGDSLIKCV